MTTVKKQSQIKKKKKLDEPECNKNPFSLALSATQIFVDHSHQAGEFPEVRE